jgi:ADP-heptose:LPS heptosyltransferase
VTTLDFATYRAVYSWHGSGSREFNQRLQAAAAGRVQVFPFRPSIAGIHQADYYARCLYAIAAPVRPVVALRDDALGLCAQYWRQQSLEHRAVLALAPGSGSREKNWPEEFFVEISGWWQQAIGGTVLVLEGPVEEERGATQRLRECCVTLSGLTLSNLAAVLSRSQLVLGNDSGVTHLAAAVGVPTIALFGPSDPAQWAPRGPSVVILRRGVDCSPCTDLSMKRCPHRVCLTEFSPREVIAALGRLPQVVTLTRFRAGITV